MSQEKTQPPKVSVVTLTNGTRPVMLQRAIQCVLNSNYPNVEHIIFDTRHMVGASIGAMRNAANATATGELIAHGDDDDLSHPRRLEEQVELLRVTGKDAVGYNDMLFWDTAEKCVTGRIGSAGYRPRNEAWLYESHHLTKFLGSSMLYKRKAWENSPFHPDEPNEDTLWWGKNQNRCIAVSSIDGAALQPRMVCAIHGANTSVAYAHPRQKAHWRRLPNWDQYCKDVMV